MTERCISYSLFGFNKPTPANCFEFDSYMRGLWMNVRLNRVLYPGWINWLNIDKASYESKYQYVFDWLFDHDLLEINICPDGEPLCKAMLWRLKPIMVDLGKGTKGWRFDAVLCRDVDSVPTYREAQAVTQWLGEEKAIHCITDSISHNIPMMGGMIGFRPAAVTNMRLGLAINRPLPESGEQNKQPNSTRWDDLLRNAREDFTQKGSDQHFLNRWIYPKCAESATEHFVKGMVHNLPEGNGRHYSIDESIEVPSVVPFFKCTNDFAGHIGAAGYYEMPTIKFINTADPYRDQYAQIESKDPHIFYWRN